MHFPRLPDWAIYVAALAAVLLASGARLQHADAPPPPDIDADEAMASAGPSLAGTAVRVPAGLGAGPRAGTAFAVNDSGVWLTARHVVENCGSVVVLTAPDRGVAARVVTDPAGEAAVLLTQGGAAGLPLDFGPAPILGQTVFHPGFPRGGAGEAASIFLGRESFVERGHGRRSYPVLAWAEAGHTVGLKGPLSGLSGAPALDQAGRVVGVTIGQSPRRGRLYTTTGAQMRHVLNLAKAAPQAGASGQATGADNYGRIADDLRRNLQVVQVVCT